METVYYMGKDGRIITSDDLKKSFYICTGKSYLEDKKSFWKFREKCFGKSISYTVKPSVEFFVENNYYVQAIKYYRDLNNCTVVEAKHAIDEMVERNF